MLADRRFRHWRNSRDVPTSIISPPWPSAAAPAAIHGPCSNVSQRTPPPLNSSNWFAPPPPTSPPPPPPPRDPPDRVPPPPPATGPSKKETGRAMAGRCFVRWPPKTF